MFDFCMAQPLLTIDRSRITGSDDGIKADSRMTNRSACNFPKQPQRACIVSQACSWPRALCDSKGQENMGSPTGKVIEPRSHLAKLLSEAEGSNAVGVAQAATEPSEQGSGWGRSHAGNSQRALPLSATTKDSEMARSFHDGQQTPSSSQLSQGAQEPKSRDVATPHHGATMPAEHAASWFSLPSLETPMLRPQISNEVPQQFLQQLIDFFLLSTPSIPPAQAPSSVAHNIAMRDGCLTSSQGPPSFPATMRLLTQDLQGNKLNELPSYVRSHVTSLTFPEKVRFPCGIYCNRSFP
jgi:hypothetical protein